MASNSEPNEGSRKTLDEIRRELDAEYGFVDTRVAASDEGETTGDRGREDGSSDDARETARDRPRAVRLIEDAREGADDRHPNARSAEPRLFAARAEARRPQTWDAEIDDDRVEQIFERHQFAMRGRGSGTERPRRLGYVLAALVGCVAGQALLLGFFVVMQYRLSGDVPRTSVPVSSPVDATASPPPKERVEMKRDSAQAKEEPASNEETAQSIVSVPPEAAPPASVQSSSAAASAPEADLPPRTSAPSSSQGTNMPAITAPQASRSRSSDVPSFRVAPRTSPARRPSTTNAIDMAETQARLRSALNEWLRTSARGVPVQSTEPVIVLGPDGRTAKTYVSIASPVGLVPREQRWELGPRGWTLVEDRQAGLPRAGTANSSR
jgi:hypothetical protein